MGLNSRWIAALGAGAIGLGAAPAYVGAETGWRLTSSISENLDVSDDGALSFTRVGVSAVTETGRMRLGFNTGFGLSLGRGNNSASLPNLGVNFTLRGKRSSISTSADIDYQPITFLEEDELDLTTTEETGIRRSIGASVRGNYELSPRLSTSLSASYRDVDYSDTSTALVPSQTTGLTWGLNYEAADDVTIAASLGARWFDADNDMNTSSFSVDSSVSATYEATSRLSLTAGAGVSWARSQDDILGLRSTTRSTALLLNGGVSYGLAHGTLRANVSQRVSPEAASGELTRFNALTIGYTHQLNQTTGLGLDLQVSDQKTITTETSTTQFSISPFVTWELLENLEARLGYSFRRRDNDATSHRVTFFVRKVFESGL